METLNDAAKRNQRSGLTKIVLVLPLIILVISLLSLASPSYAQWDITTVDNPTSSIPTITTDSSGAAHILYAKRLTTYPLILLHATNSSGSWITTTVHEGDWIRNSSIKVDSNDKLHACFTTYGAVTTYPNPKSLFYATNASGSWSVVKVGNNDSREWCDIALDSNNKAHISYYGDFGTTSYNLKYATNMSGSWQITNLDNAGNVGGLNSIAVDSNNRVHIAYIDQTLSPADTRGLKYATNVTGSWQKRWLNNQGTFTRTVAIAIGSNNSVHVVYEEGTTLRHATNGSGQWLSSSIASSSGDIFSLAVDLSNKLHFSYASGVFTRCLKYATNASGSWFSSSCIVNVGETQLYSAMAIDNDDYAHIAYKYGYSSQLQYATNCQGQTYYEDSDGDGYGNAAVTTQGCSSPPSGYVSNSTDCDDSDAARFPNNPEVCDNKDNDCDQSIDENLPRQTTCGVGECAGNTGIETCGAGSWGNNTCNPFAGSLAETCDNRDNDCDGNTDEGLSRQTTCGVGECTGNTGTESCSAGQWGNNTCNPFAGSSVEACDGLDNDCDGSIDDNLTRITTCGAGSCAGNTGTETCSVGQWGNDTCDPFAGATSETCDLSDNDCDGTIDEGFDFDGDGVSVCGGDCDDNNFDIQTCNTPVSSDPVTVTSPGGEVEITFPNVTAGGDTNITVETCDLSKLDGIAYSSPNTPCVSVETDAQWDDNNGQDLIKVCIAYDDTGMSLSQEDALSVIRCDDNDPPVCDVLGKDPNVIPNPDTNANVICVLADHFSYLATGELTDGDGDGTPDLLDNCRDVINYFQLDADNDGVGDACDACPGTPAGVPVDDAGCEVAGVNWKGDMNSDGTVDISDVIRVLRIALDLDPDSTCADINGDGIVDISDVIRTLRMALGLDALVVCVP